MNKWELRYRNGGNSGAGSYGSIADHKAEVINNLINEKNIKTITDCGCGDGNQISLIHGYDEYHGFDISPYIIDVCRKMFINKPNMHFYNSMDELPKADLILSLDVIYHIVDDNDFENYIKFLFNNSLRFVLLFTSNHTRNDNPDASDYINHRIVTDYIEKNVSKFKLTQIITNNLETSADFYLYERI